MAYNATYIRDTVVDLLDGTLTSVRQLTSGKFAYGTHDGQTPTAKKATAVQTATARHWFDVELGRLENHSDGPVSANSNYRLGIVTVRIPITTSVRSAAEATQRGADLETIATDCDDAIQALHYRDNLSQDASANATNIVSGIMLGPGGQGAPVWDLTNEDWEAGLVESEINGSVIVNITQATS